MGKGATVTDIEIGEALTLINRIPLPSVPRKPSKTGITYAERHCTLTEVGEAMGVTRERVRQIEKIALEKCRAFCERNGYRLGDLLGQ